jgi:dTDP-4-amino-4,6-dideoxygalactose transaminase
MIEVNPRVRLVEAALGEEEVAAVARVLRGGQLAQGPEVRAFEAELASVTGVTFALALNSGTAALHAGLAAAGIGRGDEVLTTPFTFAASATPVLMQGARVRFADIDPHTFNLDAGAALDAIGDARAVVLVDLFGLPFDARGIAALREREVFVFEDAAQAIGAERDGVRAGARGDAGAFSFYATKNITTGEGGAFVCADPALHEAVRRFRHHGQTDTYHYAGLGYNYRMTDLAAAIGRVQLGRLTELTLKRRCNAAFYDVRLAGISGLTTPHVPAGATHVYHQYSILIDGERTPNGADRDAVRAALGAAGIDSGIYYPKPLHLHPLFAGCGHGAGDFPVAERVARQILALPIHQRLERAQLDHVAAALRRAVGAREDD